MIGTAEWWDGALRFFAVIAVIFGLLYWRFADPDRSDRIAAYTEPQWRLLAVLISGSLVIEHLNGGRRGTAAIWGLLTLANVVVYFRERNEIRKAAPSPNLR